MFLKSKMKALKSKIKQDHTVSGRVQLHPFQSAAFSQRTAAGPAPPRASRVLGGVGAAEAITTDSPEPPKGLSTPHAAGRIKGCVVLISLSKVPRNHVSDMLLGLFSESDRGVRR